jgi:2-dehydropantoate 2-reductase
MISILGAGAVGQLLAHKLTEASVDCQLIVKPEAEHNTSEWQLIQQGKPTYHEINTITASNCGELRQLWVCVKTHQLQSALESVSHAIDDETVVVLFQNGMGHEKLAHHFVHPTQLFFISNTHGAFRRTDRSIEYAGVGDITFGHLEQSQQPEWLNPTISKALNATWTKDIKNVLWQKLFVNAVINPLTALYQCRNGDLLNTDKKPKVLALINENKRLASALNLAFADDLKDIIFNVIEKTAANQSSMLQDINNQQLTEINAINGYLLDIATQEAALVPHNWQLWSDFHIAYPPLKAQAKEQAKTLDQLSYQVTQEHGTEPPFSGSYNLHQEKGIYRCVCCNSRLFTDRSKFESGCGWPSFDQAQDNKAIAYKLDTSHGMTRTEILCAQCGSHLGHVFDDGPTETGQRFCVNSVSLNFEKDET